MFDTIHRTSHRRASEATGAALRACPECAHHPGSVVRRYRTHGPNGPGVYPQCIPAEGAPHLLAWPVAQPFAEQPDEMLRLTRCELGVLEDAAIGLTAIETAVKRAKSVETVKTQRRSIMLKLGARNMAHAVAMTLQNGVLELEHAA
jgi:DNA-binding CsgD family transcriptional regulator